MLIIEITLGIVLAVLIIAFLHWLSVRHQERVVRDAVTTIRDTSYYDATKSTYSESLAALAAIAAMPEEKRAKALAELRASASPEFNADMERVSAKVLTR